MALLFDPLYLALEFCWQGISRILLWKEEDEDVYLVKVKFALSGGAVELQDWDVSATKEKKGLFEKALISEMAVQEKLG